MTLWLRAKIAYRRYIRSPVMRHTLARNVASSGTLMLLGDLLQQTLERRGTCKSFDESRLRRMFAVGVLEGPMHHFYYTRLDLVLPGRDIRTVAMKIFLDQLIASPMFISTFFYGTGLLEGKSLSECTRQLRHNLWTVYLADWLIWPPTQFFNFYLVPASYRVLYIQGVTMMYNVFLSYVKHRDGKHTNVESSHI